MVRGCPSNRQPGSRLTALLQTLRNLGPMRLAALGGVALALIVFFVFLTTRLSNPAMSLLYADLDSADSAKIVERLEAMNVPFELPRSFTRTPVGVPSSSA